MLLSASFALLPVFMGCGDNNAPNTRTTADGSETQSDPNTPKRTPSTTNKTPDPVSPPVEIAEGWGSLKGRFKIEGGVSTASKLTINKDMDVCGKHDLRDETIVVNKSNGGISGVVVWLYTKRGDDSPKVHPSYDESENSEVVLDNLNCRFEPHVCLLRTSQTLVVKNSDAVGHNTKIDTQANPAVNRTIPSGADMKQEFETSERLPAGVSCSIHPWMKGWLVVQDSPYCAVTDADGNFEIKNLPSGNWTFQFWHEGAGYIQEPIVNEKSQEWKKGRAELTIQGSETLELGEIKIAASAFSK